MNRILLGISLSLLVLFIGVPMKTSALTFETLPVSQTSQNWKIELGKPNKEFTKVQKAAKKFNEYSLDIKKISDKPIELERIEVFRDEPNSKVKYELTTFDGNEIKTTESYHHKNLPVSLSAKKLEVTITWSKKDIDKKYDRKYQETFVFKTN